MSNGTKLSVAPLPWVFTHEKNPMDYMRRLARHLNLYLDFSLNLAPPKGGVFLFHHIAEPFRQPAIIPFPFKPALECRAA